MLVVHKLKFYAKNLSHAFNFCATIPGEFLNQSNRMVPFLVIPYLLIINGLCRHFHFCQLPEETLPPCRATFFPCFFIFRGQSFSDVSPGLPRLLPPWFPLPFDFLA
jgi:hypothetical protein